MVAAGDFREDLLFRINTFEIPLPPLRQRIDDIGRARPAFAGPLAAAHPARRRSVFARGDGVAQVAQLAGQHPRVGQRRRACRDPLRNAADHGRAICPTGSSAAAARGSRNSTPPAALSLREIEMQAIRNSLDRNAGSKPKTAEELGISLKTLYNKLHQEAELERTA